jgi:predicted ATPase
VGKLDTVLALTSTSAKDTALFAEMLSLPNDGRYPTLDSAPELRRQRTLEALVSQMETLTRLGPVLMIFENAHWADPKKDAAAPAILVTEAGGYRLVP